MPFARFEGELDEFCADVTTVSLIDGTETTSDRKCLQNALDLGPVSTSEETAFVKQSLGSCKGPEYPAGTSADDPTGRGDGAAAPTASAAESDAGESGCAASGKSPRPNALVGVLAIGLCLLGKRRARRLA